MPRARRKPLSADLKPAVAEVADFGPAIRRKRGEVVVQDVGDPDQPRATIRRGRVAWVPDAWLGKGTIDRRAHAAAVQLRDDHERGIHGAQDRPCAKIALVSRSGDGMSVARLDAATRYQRAMRAVGITLSPALAWCVLCVDAWGQPCGGTVEEWAALKGWHHRRATGYLLAALDVLADHYDGA
jgi:hypothetical protein